MIDCNITLFRWPFRRLPKEETGELLDRLKGYDVKEAWASSFEGLFHKDIEAVNRRLAEECRDRGQGVLVPFGAINPLLPDWEEDLRRCREVHRMPGIRLFPGYHGYSLDSPLLSRLFRLAGESGVIVQLAVLLEDSRTQHPLVQVPETDLRPLLRLLPQFPSVPVMILNYRAGLRGAPLLRQLMETSTVYADMSNVEAAGGVRFLFEQIPEERVVFGSHAPFFLYESALLKLQESNLSARQLQSVLNENARRLRARFP